MNNIKFKSTTIAILFFSLTQDIFADSSISGNYIPNNSGSSNIQKQINQNIIETEQNIKACEAHLVEIRKIHQKIRYKLDNFEKLTLNSRLELIRKDIQKYELELKHEKDVVKKRELMEIIEAVKEVSRDIEKGRR